MHADDAKLTRPRLKGGEVRRRFQIGPGSIPLRSHVFFAIVIAPFGGDGALADYGNWSIQGTVVDSTRAVLPNASITSNVPVGLAQSGRSGEPCRTLRFDHQQQHGLPAVIDAVQELSRETIEQGGGASSS
jgi:hypothetical protein